MLKNSNKLYENDKTSSLYKDDVSFKNIITLSDTPPTIIDHVVCVDFEGLTETEERYLKSLDFFKVTGFKDDFIIVEGNKKFHKNRFKKIETSSNVKVGDYVIINNKVFTNLPVDVVNFLKEKNFYIVFSMKKGLRNNYVIDIGIRNDKNATYWLDISRFLSLKTPYEYRLKAIEDSKILVDNHDKDYWINPNTIEVAHIIKKDDVSVNIEVVNIDNRKLLTMTYDTFVEYYEPIERKHMDILNEKMLQLDIEKNEDIKNIIEKYKPLIRYYKNVIFLINKKI